MNVVETNCPHKGVVVGDVSGGLVVRFHEQFHQSHSVNAPFIVCVAPDGYRPDHDQYGCKVAVANLRTGRISYVSAKRVVTVHKAECVIDSRGRYER